MTTYSIVPPNSIVAGRYIHEHVREDGYHKYYWSCVIHKVKSEKPMRIKDMKARKGPRCCYDRSGKLNPNWDGYEEIPMTYIKQVERSADLRGILHEITPLDMWQVWLEQNAKCAYTGRKIFLGVDASLDRRDSNIGYVRSNIQWVHKDVNMAKQSMSEELFIKLCKDVANWYSQEDSMRWPEWATESLSQ